ncbi:hypothetical protein ARMGADRAFT_945611 [Armillaria gallica]|uniref:RNase H type-1 domain-containing protein n=1 Tax=Armillaria gallica TaxID=47427 RepID=A0A2H3CME3_ARMGA|nr:hypothetical protein ARMGADRAFT_945611 [Armillaria gallica]
MFKPHLITMGTIADAFRIFVDNDESSNIYNNPGNEPTMPGIVTTVYTDGSAINCETDDAAPEAGIVYQNDNTRNHSIRLLNEIGRMNQVSEMIGAKTAAEDIPTSDMMELVTPDMF